jgi:CRP/FNR family cyclic AMP-dependent transcriptional regulator
MHTDDTAHRLVRILEVHPDLGEDLGPAAFEEARRLLTAPLLELPTGLWSPAEVAESPAVRGRPFGCIVTSGVIVREVLLADRVSTSLFGPRDVLGMDDLSDVSLPVRSRYLIASPSEIVPLDDRFLGAARRWPRLIAGLMDATTSQVGRGCVHQAVSQLPRVEDRLVALFWHLADRWGHVGPEGITLDLPLTHEALGRLIGARRPTVSLGLQVLGEREMLTRTTNGGWLLSTGSIEVLARDGLATERLRSVLAGRGGRRLPADGQRGGAAV